MWYRIIPLDFSPSFRMGIPETDNPSDYCGYRIVLEMVSMMHARHFRELSQKSLQIYNRQKAANPLCDKEKEIVVLSAEPNRLCQVAFQYAHELCHFTIPLESPPQILWLEESVCQMASLYYLRKLSSSNPIVNEKPVPHWGEYAPHFMEYAIAESAKNTQVDLRDLREISSLEADAHQRRKNAWVANQMLPVFEESEDVWQALPAISQIDEFGSLEKIFDRWRSLSPHRACLGLSQIQKNLSQLVQAR